jgi:hypothetical protein
MSTQSNIDKKFAEASEVELAEKATNLRRWAEAVDSPNFEHAHGTFSKGNTAEGGGSTSRFTKGGGGPKKHRCVWGALADLRVQDGVGSWSYGGYSDDEAVGQNMPSQALASFVGLAEGDVVADITRKYMATAMGSHYAARENVANTFVSYNDASNDYGVLSKVMRDTAADIERRLKERQLTAS